MVISESKYQLNNSKVSTLFVRPCHVRSSCSHRGWAKHRAMLDNIYLLSAVPLANVAPDFSHFGSTISRGVKCMPRH